jgi:tripartite-type tricarboxylate transporter receptor subunit TctC
MYKNKFKFFAMLITLLITFMVIASFVTFAKGYPEKPVEIIVPWSAGGSTDACARLIAAELTNILGEKFLVINKPGASGEIGFTLIALAKPDGYTIGIVNVPASITPYLRRPKEAKYTIDSFEPIALLVNDAQTISIRVESEFKSLEEYVKYAKENPGALTMSNDGIGATAHLSQLAFEQMAGIEIKKVAFTGDAPQRAALLGGHIASAGIRVSEVYPYYKEGLMRVLGVMADKRVSFLPDVPTFKELGYPLSFSSARGLCGPKGMPPEIVKILSDAVERAVNSESFIKKAEQMKMPIDYRAGEEYGTFLKNAEEITKGVWSKLSENK